MNIVFDLGGVVVRWEPQALISDVFTDPDVRKVVYEKFVGHPDWIALDRGTLTPEDAAARAARRTGLSEHEIGHFLRQVPPALVANPETVDLLYRLKAQGHSLFCLSNMHHASIEHLEKAYTFWQVFSGKVISCRLHLCKPEPAIYTYLLDTYALVPSQTIFVDDVEVNLTAARRFGVQTVRFQSPSQCHRRLKAFGCL